MSIILKAIWDWSDFPAGTICFIVSDFLQHSLRKYHSNSVKNSSKNRKLLWKFRLWEKNAQNNHYWEKTIGSTLTLWSKNTIFFTHPPLYLQFYEISPKMHQYGWMFEKNMVFMFFWSNFEYLKKVKHPLKFHLRNLTILPRSAILILQIQGRVFEKTWHGG